MQNALTPLTLGILEWVILTFLVKQTK